MSDEEIDKLVAGLEALTAQARELKGPGPEKLITAQEAAAKVNVPVRTVYDWSRGKWWAKRPTGGTLRIQEAGFMTWFNSPKRRH